MLDSRYGSGIAVYGFINSRILYTAICRTIVCVYLSFLGLFTGGEVSQILKTIPRTPEQICG